MNARLDPRTLLLMAIIAPIMMALQISLYLEILIMVIYISPFLLSKKYKTGLIFMTIYMLQLLLALIVLPHVTSMFFLFALSMLTNGLRRMLPGFMVGTYIVLIVPSNEWIALFKRWHLPKFLIVPFAVIIRFFPTVIEDYRQIRRAMAFRGIGSHFTDLIKHPLQTFEFILIPILMNASQVAIDLTISALTKGLSRTENQSSIVTLAMTTWDYAYILITFIPVILYLGGFL